MVKKLARVITYALAIFLLTACISAKEKAFIYLVPVGDMNSSIKLEMWEPNDINNLRIGDEISLALINVSNYEISFPSDYGAFIFTYDEGTGEWNEVPNGMIYASSGTNELPRMASDEQGIEVKVLPIIENNNQPVDIRVVIISTSTDQSIPFSKEVGAYIDLTLQP